MNKFKLFSALVLFVVLMFIVGVFTLSESSEQISIDEIVKLLKSADTKIKEGMIEQGLSLLAKAKRKLTVNMLDLTIAGTKAKVGDLVFSFQKIHSKTHCSDLVGCPVDVFVEVENLGKTEVSTAKVNLRLHFDNIKVETYLITPDGIQRQTDGAILPNHILPGQRALVKPSLYFDKDEFKTGKYTAVFRIEGGKETRYIKGKGEVRIEK